MATQSTSTSTLVLVLLGVLVVVPFLFMAGAMLWGGPMTGTGPMMGDGGTWGGMGSAGGWWALVGLGLQFLFLAVLVAVAYLAYSRFTERDDTDRAVEELRLAYARGDLTEEEYDERRERLERDRTS